MRDPNIHPERLDDRRIEVIEALEVDVAGARKVGSARLVLERPGRSLLTECQK